jgi:hypothetical protein
MTIPSLDVAYITTLSALAGSVVGGLTTGITTWMSLRSQARAGRLTEALVRRQDLFRDFIVAASKTYGEALLKNEPQVQEIVALWAMISRMRVLCSPEIAACAEKVMFLTIDTYFAPNKTVRELRDLMKSGEGFDPLRQFSELAREELRAFNRL